MSTSIANCTRCNGAGQIEHWRHDGTMVTCHCCNGRGTFESPDLKQLCADIKRLQAKHCPQQAAEDPRAYFLWRMIRFHTGKDVTLPMTASMAVDHDPFKPTLEAAAVIIARHFTGRDSIGSAGGGMQCMEKRQ